MELKKRGVFFSFVGILLIGLLLYSASMMTGSTLVDEAIIVENRVQAMNNFLVDIEKDIERGLYIASFRAVFNEINYITEVNHSFIPDAEKTLIELLINGSIDGNKTLGEWMGNNNTFTNWTQKILYQADNMNMLLNISILDIDVYQDDPWYITIEINTSITLKDERNIANWSINKTTKALVSVENFEDPIFSVYSNHKLYRFVTKAIDTDFVVGPDNDTTPLMNYVNNSFYSNTANSPNFLMRLEGDLSADPNGFGIESLIDRDFFEARMGVSIDDYNKSQNDYVFLDWSIANNTGCFTNNTPSWFKVDQNSVTHYQVENFTNHCG